MTRRYKKRNNRKEKTTQTHTVSSLPDFSVHVLPPPSQAQSIFTSLYEPFSAIRFSVSGWMMAGVLPCMFSSSVGKSDCSYTLSEV